MLVTHTLVVRGERNEQKNEILHKVLKYLNISDLNIVQSCALPVV